MEVEKSALMELPKEILDLIMRRTDFQTIQCLRKVSRPLRDFIDEKKMEVNLLDLAIDARAGCIDMMISAPRLSLRIEYKKQGNDCLVRCNDRSQKVIRNEDFMKVARNDIRDILKHHKAVMRGGMFSFQNESFHFRSPLYFDYITNLKNDLQATNGNLKIKHIECIVLHEDQVVDILQLVDLEPLKSIRIISYVQNYEDIFSLNRLVTLPHWRKAEQLVVSGFIVNASIQNFSHFKKAEVFVFNMSIGKVNTLKNAYIALPGFNRVFIEFRHFSDFPNFLENFAHPFVEGPQLDNDIRGWFFAIPSSDKALHITIHRNHGITFRAVERPPQDILIMN
ncbi:hypothetical protein GCK72_013253 [Caenorhabditis remanei]|uniref:F-box domain-containing protein n=1 Tax=Caenorhabditis remanei TaxID=31234 RepID=A0A6A5GQQ1_CAERE|nr:hypothetical protein GCK72_013253 [Caenorhabditis remanei]KAF1756799.1 hypothetical protein GCK72_013253 [Caenorhabditis remanei]